MTRFDLIVKAACHISLGYNPDDFSHIVDDWNTSDLTIRHLLDQSINIINSSNVVTGTINAGGNVVVGNSNNINTPK